MGEAGPTRVVMRLRVVIQRGEPVRHLPAYGDEVLDPGFPWKIEGNAHSHMGQ